MIWSRIIKYLITFCQRFNFRIKAIIDSTNTIYTVLITYPIATFINSLK